MPTWTFVKRSGAPAGTINIDLQGVGSAGVPDFTINDAPGAQIVTTDSSAAWALMHESYLALDGVAVDPVTPNPDVRRVFTVNGVLTAVANDGGSTSIDAGTAPDATVSVKGSVKLAGDLAGTAAAPTVPGKVDKTVDNVVSAAIRLSTQFLEVKGTSEAPVTYTPGGANNAAQQVVLSGPGRLLHYRIADISATGALVGLGVDYGNASYPQGQIIANKAQSRGLVITQAASITDTFAYGLLMLNSSTSAYPARFEQTVAAHKPYLFVAGAASAGDHLVEFTATAGQAGYVASDTGQLVWNKPIFTGGNLIVGSTAAIAHATTGTKVTVSNSSSGNALLVTQSLGATGTALYVQQLATGAAAAKFEQGVTGIGSNAVLTLAIAGGVTPTAGDRLQRWMYNTGSEAGYVDALSGQFTWNRQIYAGASLIVSGNTSMQASSAATVAGNAKAAASQTADIFQVLDSSANVLCRFTAQGYFTTKKVAAPVDSVLGNSEVAFWLDDTAGATKLKIKAKDSAGTVRTGEVALT